MPQKWLQVKSDPSVRAFLARQSRVESLFDGELDRDNVEPPALTCV